ncbi:1219_t:CDS:2, partial [Dentiscutata erythropus]
MLCRRGMGVEFFSDSKKDDLVSGISSPAAEKIGRRDIASATLLNRLCKGYLQRIDIGDEYILT